MPRKLLIILVTALLLFFAYKFAKSQGWLPSNVFSQIEEKMPDQINLPWQKDQEFNFEKQDFEKLGEEGLSQIKTLAQKAKEAGTVGQEFVQEIVKVDENNEKNISEKAFDYGRYIYCQEVVKQYETNRSSVSF